MRYFLRPFYRLTGRGAVARMNFCRQRPTIAIGQAMAMISLEFTAMVRILTSVELLGFLHENDHHCAF